MHSGLCVLFRQMNRRAGSLAALLAWSLGSAPALAASPAPSAPQEINVPKTARYMSEDFTCGGWLRIREVPYNAIEKASALNWVLGYLSRASFGTNEDILKSASPSGISAWLDSYCEAHPLDSLVTAAFKLEADLRARVRR